MSALDTETLEKICDAVESSDMLRFVLPHDIPHIAELVENPFEIETAAGLIAVTSDDNRPSLLRAREALERLLSTLTTLGVPYAFVNQPIEVPRLRRDLWRLIRTPKPPQLLLRIGRAHTAMFSLDVDPAVSRMRNEPR